ncbi:MAG: hypothetical protein EHM48_04775 [Planctomycetaceae bacterium]|nr:MAG: hypothetical protein EHM48_04775 [Planctomycetaceae bacterium]
MDIRVGFATLKDKVFFVSGGNNGGLCIAKHPDTGKEYTIEEAATAPAVRIADVRFQEDSDAATRRIIFPYRRTGGKFGLIPEDELASSFPGAYSYLVDCRSLLESRDKGKRTYEAWYAWGRTQGRDAPGPKLLTKTFSKTPQFFIDHTDRLFCNGYGLFPLRETLFSAGTDLRVIKLILESRVMHYYAKLTAFQIDGDFQCYQKNFIERFSIPALSSDDEESILHLDDDTRETFIASLYAISEADISEILGAKRRLVRVSRMPLHVGAD